MASRKSARKRSSSSSRARTIKSPADRVLDSAAEPAAARVSGKLYYGDNLDVLDRHIKDESVDLVYLDPPFQSGKDYNVLFRGRDGAKSTAQIKAFEDTWHWSIEAEESYEQTVESGGRVADAMCAFRSFLGDSDMMAYLSMMAPRLVELRRALKSSGSIYLHCDPNASHYLKMLMDATFGPENFRNEIIWKRTTAHSSAKRYAPVHDVILYYTKSSSVTWNSPREPYDEAYLDKYYKFDDGDGRLHWRADITGAGVRHGETGKPWRGVDVTAKGRHWAYTPSELDRMDAEGLVYWPPRGTMPQEKRYRDQLKGRAVADMWTDIDRINPVGRERLGYPTQKPEALMDRILEASSNVNDVVLDPFCGCGTTVAAAQKLGRNWIGIDITHLAIGLIKHRLRGGFADANFEVLGEPVAVEGAAQLAKEDPYQFQWWILGLVGARGAEQKKGADRGIDGRLYFHEGDRKGTRQIIFSVKAGKPGVSHVRDLRGVIEREEAEIGALLLMKKPTSAMVKEAAAAGFYKSHWGRHPRIQILTAEQLLAGEQLDYPAPKYTNVTHRKVLKVRPPDPDEQMTFKGMKSGA